MIDLTSEKGTARVIEIVTRVAMAGQVSLLLDIGYKRDDIIAIIDQAIQIRNPLRSVPPKEGG